MDQMVVVCQAVRRGVSRALVSGDFPYGPLQEGAGERRPGGHPAGQGGRRRPGQARRRGRLPGRGPGRRPRRHPGVRPARRHPAGGAAATALDYAAMARPGAQVPDEMAERLVAEAKAAGGRRRGAAGLHQLRAGGRAPRSPGRCRSRCSAASAAAPGWTAGSGWRTPRSATPPPALDDPPDTYADVAQVTFDALTAYAADVRAAQSDPRRHPGAAADAASATDRRHPHPVRGVRGRPAAADVLARRVRLDAGELDRGTASTRGIELLARLREHFTCITFDRRESGRVRRPAGADPAGTHWVAQGAGLLDHLGIERAHLIGALRRLLDRGRVRGRAPGPRTDRMVLYSPAGGPRYRMTQLARFARARRVRRPRTGWPRWSSWPGPAPTQFAADPRVGPVGDRAAHRRRVRRAVRGGRPGGVRGDGDRRWRGCCSTGTPSAGPSRRTCWRWTSRR